MSEWISIKDKMPSLGQFIVAVRTPWPTFYWMGIYKGVPTEEEDMITHWMPLRAPPSK